MHEAHYFGFCADSERTPFALFLHGPDIPDYRDANRALRLRDDGRGPDAIAAEVIAYYRSRGLAVAADIDAPAEAQGIGAALRKRGCTPVSGDTLLMRYAGPITARNATTRHGSLDTGGKSRGPDADMGGNRAVRLSGRPRPDVAGRHRARSRLRAVPPLSRNASGRTGGARVMSLSRTAGPEWKAWSRGRNFGGRAWPRSSFRRLSPTHGSGTAARSICSRKRAEQGSRYTRNSDFKRGNAMSSGGIFCAETA